MGYLTFQARINELRRQTPSEAEKYPPDPPPSSPFRLSFPFNDPGITIQQ